jgi:hypothetical protein
LVGVIQEWFWGEVAVEGQRWMCVSRSFGGDIFELSGGIYFFSSFVVWDVWLRGEATVVVGIVVVVGDEAVRYFGLGGGELAFIFCIMVGRV